MKAITFDRFGSPDVLRLEEVEKPTTRHDGLLVRIRAAAANPYDWHFLTGLPYVGRYSFGIFKPRVSGLGADLAGVVEEVGRGVTEFKPGDEIFGEVDGEVPGRANLELGSFAEYVCVSQDSVVHKPRNLTFEEAAAVPLAGHTALQAIRDRGGVEPGQKVLINGASGGVGTFAVQIAKSLGADVTGVCSTRNLELIRSIGADEVIDYTREDFTRSGSRYDLMLDNVGNRKLSDNRRILSPGGVYVASFGSPENRWLGPLGRLIGLLALAPFVSQEMIVLNVKRTKQALLDLKELIEGGKVTPVIDRVYELSEAPEAMRYLEGGHARGKVVIRA